jgi:hypothetical protein
MKSSKQLKLEARQRATSFGHMLSQFIVSEGVTLAVCKRCQRKAEFQDGMLVLRADGALTARCS